jgi:hypothetical protein
MNELDPTADGTVIGFTNRELYERWSEIVQALTNAAIAPDPLTLAALMQGTSTLMAQRGMRPLTNERQRPIGFAPDGGQR